VFHLAAYFKSIAQNAYTELSAVSDDYLTLSGSNRFLMREDTDLVLAVALGLTIDRARLNSPSLRNMGGTHLWPVEKAAVPGARPSVVNLLDFPFTLPKSEELVVEAYQTSAGAEGETVLLWLQNSREPLPQGDVYRVRGTSTTAAVANAWTSAVLTLDQALPPGRYALINSLCQSTNGIAHRWIVPNQLERPGMLSVTAIANQTSPIFTERRLGTMGYFLNDALPTLQVMCNAADAAHVIHMELVRVG